MVIMDSTVNTAQMFSLLQCIGKIVPIYNYQAVLVDTGMQATIDYLDPEGCLAIGWWYTNEDRR